MKPDETLMDERQAPGAQARAWIVRLRSGDATQNDLGALARWRALDQGHERAYQAELRMWQALGPAIAAQDEGRPALPPAPMLSRRWMLRGGAGLAASAVVGVVLVGGAATPAGATKFETGKGERRHMRLAPGIDMMLNTDSRAFFWAGESPARIALDRGEAMFSVTYDGDQRLLASANGVDVTAHRARFVLRDDDGTTRVACLDGTVSVRSGDKAYALNGNRTLALAPAAQAPVEAVVLDSEAAWQRGLFVFRDRPAGEVVAELNRYRAGRVYLPGDRSSVRISGVIRIDRIDLAVDHIARSLGMKVVRLPGGVAFLRS